MKRLAPALASFLAVGVLAVTGCATAPATSTDTVRLMTPQHKQELELRRVAMASSLAADDRGSASAELRVCVAPDGSARSVTVKRSSGSEQFDGAARAEMETAQYRQFAAPSGTIVCGNMEVVVRDN